MPSQNRSFQTLRVSQKYGVEGRYEQGAVQGPMRAETNVLCSMIGSSSARSSNVKVGERRHRALFLELRASGGGWGDEHMGRKLLEQESG